MATPRLSATVKAAAASCSAFDLCGCIQRALLTTRRRHGVQVQEQLCRRALHTRADGLDVADHLVCKGVVCTRVCDRVLRRCHAEYPPVGVVNFGGDCLWGRLTDNRSKVSELLVRFQHSALLRCAGVWKRPPDCPQPHPTQTAALRETTLDRLLRVARPPHT